MKYIKMMCTSFLVVSVNIVCMDTGIELFEPSPSKLDFEKLIAHGAAELKVIAQRGQKRYYPDLVRAQSLLAEKLGYACNQDLVDIHCSNRSDIQFVYDVAQEAKYGQRLRDGIYKKINTAEIVSFLQLKPHLVNHYCPCLVAQCQVPLLQYVITLADNDDSYQKYVDILLKAGACADSIDEHGATVIHKTKSSGLLFRFMQAGIPLQVKDNAGRTPLMTQIMMRNKPGIQFLLCNGAYFHERDNEGRSVLDYINDYFQEDSHWFKVILEFRLCFVDGVAAQQIIDAGVDVNVPGYDGKNPLETAIQYNQVPKIKLLLKAGAIVTQSMIESAQSDEIKAILLENYEQK